RPRTEAPVKWEAMLRRMRGRPPRLLELSKGDAAYLEQLLRDGRTEQRVARRAWMLLAMADPTTKEPRASHRAPRRELAGAQRALRAPDRVVLDPIEDAPVGRAACPLNLFKNLSDSPLGDWCRTPDEPPRRQGRQETREKTLASLAPWRLNTSHLARRGQ